MQLREWIMALSPVIDQHATWVKLGCATESSEPFGTALRNFLAEWNDAGRPALPHCADPSLDLNELRDLLMASAKTWPPRYDNQPELAQRLWQRVDSLLITYASIRFPEPAPVEPIGVLAGGANPVSHEQIARIYGWYTPGGAPDTKKVRDELQNPGSQTDKGSYLPPDVREITARREAALSGARLECNQRNALLLSLHEPMDNVAELANQKVSVAQIAKMTGKTPDVIRELLDLGNIDYVENYALDIVDPRLSVAQRRYDDLTFTANTNGPPDADFSDDLLAAAAAAGRDTTQRVDQP